MAVPNAWKPHIQRTESAIVLGGAETICRTVHRGAAGLTVVGLAVGSLLLQHPAAGSTASVPPVARVQATLPDTLFTHASHSNCISRLQEQEGSDVIFTLMCYEVRKPALQPPPPPPPYHAVFHDVLIGTFNEATDQLSTSFLDCTELVPGVALQISQVTTLAKAGSSSGVIAVVTDTTPPLNCVAESQTTGPVTVTPLAQSHDEDLDGCTDWEELGSGEMAGGLRDPFNFWDFYDVWTHPPGNPTAWVRDKVVTLLDDVIGVSNRFGTSGDPNGDPLVPPTNETGYHVAFDRGPALGPGVWNLGPADGTISLLDDVFAASFQFGHTCAAAP